MTHDFDLLLRIEQDDALADLAHGFWEQDEAAREDALEARRDAAREEWWA